MQSSNSANFSASSALSFSLTALRRSAAAAFCSSVISLPFRLTGLSSFTNLEGKWANTLPSSLTAMICTASGNSSAHFRSLLFHFVPAAAVTEATFSPLMKLAAHSFTLIVGSFVFVHPSLFKTHTQNRDTPHFFIRTRKTRTRTPLTSETRYA